MGKKLYIYSICLAVVYVIFVGHSLYEGSRLFVSGFKEGYDLSHTQKQPFVCGGDLTPIRGTAAFPTRMPNLKTGEEVRLEIVQMMAILTQIPETIPFYVKILDAVRIFLSLILFVLFLSLPFVVYRIMKSISNNDFYSIKNINRIRKVSFMLLGIFIVILLSNICLVEVTNAYLQIEGYKASVKNFNYSLLFLGLVTLVLSEILRYTTSMKEEQELTV